MNGDGGFVVAEGVENDDLQKWPIAAGPMNNTRSPPCRTARMDILTAW